MILVYYLIIINILTFIFYGIDKKKAEKQKYRISEAFLIFMAVLGGALGALIGMITFHHKTRKPKFKICVPLFLILWTVFCIFSLYQNYHLVVTEYEYESDFDCTIVQISDLHNQFFGVGQKALLDEIKNADPDIIVVTGDVIDVSHTNYGLAKQFFEGAVKIAPVYYITGNHEVWLYGEKFDAFLEDIEAMGVTFLDGETAALDNMILAGTVDGREVREYNWEDETKLKLLLAHEPSNYTNYKNTGADIILAGHVHGGQVIIPGKGGLLSPDFGFFPEFYGGEYTSDNSTMIVSRGLGNSVLPVRINDYPEIVVLKIKNAVND